jgi:hypothetical protein
MALGYRTRSGSYRYVSSSHRADELISRVAYEVHPFQHSPSIHETFLGGWGLPIGELFDTRQLAKKCKELNQYTFFFTSMVLNVPGGIASPPNAQAIL